MNWDRIEGNWKQVTGKAKVQWGKLTDDDLDVIAGRRDVMAGKIVARTNGSPMTAWAAGISHKLRRRSNRANPTRYPKPSATAERRRRPQRCQPAVRCRKQPAKRPLGSASAAGSA